MGAGPKSPVRRAAMISSRGRAMAAEQDEAAAAEWLAREDRGLSVEEQGALDAWLSQSSLNRVAYLRLKTVWQRADRLAALKNPLTARRRSRVWSLPAAAAIAA